MTARRAKVDLRIIGPFRSPDQLFINPAPNLMGNVVRIGHQPSISQFFSRNYTYYKSRQEPRQNLTKERDS